jgi:hypothetical protein
MFTIEMISLYLSVISLVATIILGILAIKISKNIDLKSSHEIEIIKQSAKNTEENIKQNLNILFNHILQTDTKVLDSFLAKINSQENNDTKKDENLELIKDKQQITSDEIKEIKRSTISEVKSLLTEAKKDDLGTEGTADNKRSRANLSVNEIAATSALNSTLMQLQKTPAYYVILAVIIKENINSLHVLEGVRKKYNLPYGWESGIEHLLKTGIINGTKSHFEVQADYLPNLKDWIIKNSNIINKLIEYYKNAEKKGLTKEEIEIAQEMRFN